MRVEYPSAVAPDATKPASTTWLAQIWEHRGLVRLLVVRDLKVRYKRSVLGFLWTLLNPLLTILIFTMVFSRIFSTFYEEYKLYMISGVLIWNFFSLATAQGLNSLVGSSNTIRRMALPKSVFTISSVCSNFVNFLFSIAALALVFPLLGGKYSWALLWLLVVLPILFTFTLGLSLFLATVTVFVRDLRDFWDPLLMVWFFLTPVFYPRSVIPPKYYTVLRLNPMLSILETCRVPLYLGTSPTAGLLFKSLLSAILALAIGAWIFRRYEKKFVFYV